MGQNTRKAISVKKLCKSYKVPQKEKGLKGSFKNLIKRKYKIIEAVTNVTFSIDEGEFVGFIGPNGAGKTTTIKILSGIIHPDSGEIDVFGYIPTQHKNEFKKSFSVVMGQKGQLWWDIPAIDSFSLFKEIYRIPDDVYKANIAELSELLDIKHLMDTPVRNLSLGERMKFELMGALLHNPKILFLDEPTIGLDVLSRKRIKDFLTTINVERNQTIIFTSHYIEDIRALCKRIIAIDKGKIRYDGSFEKISKRITSYKLLTISFNKVISRVELEKYGNISKINDNKAVFHVRKEDLNIVSKNILEHEDIIDFTIEDQPVDEVFEKIFSENNKESL